MRSSSNTNASSIFQRTVDGASVVGVVSWIAGSLLVMFAPDARAEDFAALSASLMTIANNSLLSVSTLVGGGALQRALAAKSTAQSHHPSDGSEAS